MNFIKCFFVTLAFISSFGIQTLRAAEYTAIGICQVAVINPDFPEVIIEQPFIMNAGYSNLEICNTLEPSRCETEFQRVYAAFGEGTKALLKGGTAVSYYRWDCLPWNPSERVPFSQKVFQRAPKPRPYFVEPNPELNFKDLPSLEKLLQMTQDLWNFVNKHSSEIPWTIYLSICAILLGLGLLKSGQLVLTGPGALEPASVALALSAILALLWADLPETEKDKYKDLKQAMITPDTEHTDRWVITDTQSKESINIQIKQDGTWTFKSKSTCIKGTTDESSKKSITKGC